MNYRILILAAGKGTRMKHSKDMPKVLVEINEKPLIQYILDAVLPLSVDSKPVVVVGYRAALVRDFVGNQCEYAFQDVQLGTGHAVSAAKSELRGSENIMVLNGDHPLINPQTICNLIQTHISRNNILSMITTKVEDFNDWSGTFNHYGRIIRSEENNVRGIKEFKDANEEQKKITEVNPNYFCFNAKWLWENIDKIKNENAQTEYYLTDLVQLAVEQGHTIDTVEADPRECLGVNTPEQLELVKQYI